MATVLLRSVYDGVVFRWIVAAACILLQAGLLQAFSTEAELLEKIRDPSSLNGTQFEESSLGLGGVPLLRRCIERSWWRAARRLVQLQHGQGGIVVADEIKQVVGDMKRRADEFAAFADTTYREQTAGLDDVHCALQWAQNTTVVFLQVKYAARWSAPGAIEIADLSVNITPCCFELSAYGHHSSIRKHYVVSLELFDGVSASSGTWSSASVGRLTATLPKAKTGVWPRLTKQKDRGRNPITKWLDMQEKWASSLESEASEQSSTSKQASSTSSSSKTKEKEAKGKTPKNNSSSTRHAFGKVRDYVSEKLAMLRKRFKKLVKTNKVWFRRYPKLVGLVLGCVLLAMLWWTAKRQVQRAQASSRTLAAGAAEARQEKQAADTANVVPPAD